MLTNLSGSIAQYLSGVRDQLSSAIPGLPGLPAPITYVGTSGTFSGRGAPSGAGSGFTVDASSATGQLFTIHRHVHSGMTQVAVRLTAAGRSWLAQAGGAKLRISLTFTPKRGRATSVHRIVALSPPIPPGASG